MIKLLKRESFNPGDKYVGCGIRLLEFMTMNKLLSVVPFLFQSGSDNSTYLRVVDKIKDNVLIEFLKTSLVSKCSVNVVLLFSPSSFSFLSSPLGT
jgi:hypothetical protein